MAAAVGYGSHTHWRVFATDNNGGATYTGIQEVQFLDATDTLIPATGGTVLYSSQVAGTDAAEAFDGLTTTGDPWLGSGIASQYIGYAFATPKAVNSVKLWGPNSNALYAPQNSKLQYSDDGTTWSDAYNFAWTLPVTYQQRTFPEAAPAAGYHRAWRLFVHTVQSGTGTGFDELQLRATPSGADQTAAVGAATANASGRAIWSATTTGNDAWRVWDNVTGTANYWWTTNGSGTNQWVGFIFPDPVKVEEIAITAANASLTAHPKSMSLQYSDDGVTWTTQKTFAEQAAWTANEARVLAAT